MKEGRFEINHLRSRQCGAVFRFCGNAELSSRFEIQSQLLPVARRKEMNWMVVDVGALCSIDSCSLGTLVMVHLILKSKHGALVLANVGDFVRRSLRATGLDRVLPVMGSVETAENWLELNCAYGMTEDDISSRVVRVL